MANIKTDTLTSARRDLDNTSSKILHELYCAYPKEVSLKAISKKLRVVEKTVQMSIKRITQSGLPIDYNIDKNKNRTVRANFKEPITWILKEKKAAENMLSLFEDIEINGNETVNNKRKINRRIYIEYLNSLNELFDKWNSLRLLEKLEEPIPK